MSLLPAATSKKVLLAKPEETLRARLIIGVWTGRTGDICIGTIDGRGRLQLECGVGPTEDHSVSAGDGFAPEHRCVRGDRYGDDGGKRPPTGVA